MEYFCHKSSVCSVMLNLFTALWSGHPVPPTACIVCMWRPKFSSSSVQSHKSQLEQKARRRMISLVCWLQLIGSWFSLENRTERVQKSLSVFTVVKVRFNQSRPRRNVFLSRDLIFLLRHFGFDMLTITVSWIGSTAYDQVYRLGICLTSLYQVFGSITNAIN